MKKTFKFIAFAAMAAASILFVACSSDSDSTNPSEVTVTFNSVSEAIYHGDANRNSLGLYTITLQTEGQQLSLEFTSALTDAVVPVPDEEAYDFSAGNELNTFNNKSLWLSKNDGTEISRRLSSGSFTWEATGKGYKLAGSVVGNDGIKLIFNYEGPVNFLNQGSKPGEVTVTFDSVSEATYHGDANRNGLGLYTMTLQAEGQQLSLEFTSTLTDAIVPVPDEEVYNFSADNNLNTFNNKSSWLSENNGMEINRKLASGSFTWEATEQGYKLVGSVAGNDETKLVFNYEGPVNFLDMNSKPAEDAIVCQGAYGTYYGKYYIPNAADYYLVIYDTPHTSSGDPYSYRICLDFSSITPAGSLMPAMGTYRVDSEGTFAEGTFVPGMMAELGTLWQVPSGSGSSRYNVTDGFFTIRRTEDSRFQIFGTLKDAYGQEISFNYVGGLSFANEAVGKFTSLTADFAMGEAFYANQKCYFTSPEGNMWKMFLYDEASWTSKGKEGYFVSFDIALPADLKAIPEGKYNMAEHVLLPGMGEFIAGYIFAYDSSFAEANGSWLAKGNGSNTLPYAPIRGGTMDLVKNSDNTFTVTFDVQDDDFVPKRITGSYTGEIPLTSDSQAASLFVRQAARQDK